MLAFFIVLLYFMWITPVRVGATLTWREGELARGQIGVTAWGVGLRRPWRAQREKNGRVRLVLDGAKKKARAPEGKYSRRVARLVNAYRTGDLARAALKRSLTLDALRARASLHLPSAAATACVCALLRAALFRRLGDIDVAPAFIGKNAIDGLCIVSFRLGNLLVACALGASAYRKAGKEEGAWNTIPLTN